MSRSVDRAERLNLIESLLPLQDSVAGQGLTVKEISEKLENNHPGSLSIRSIERDLQALVADGRICINGKRGKSLSYCRVVHEGLIDSNFWEYFIHQMKSQLEGIVSNTDLTKILVRLKKTDDGIELDERKICILPDNLRLKPAPLDYKIFCTILKALKEGISVRIRYKDRHDNVTEPLLHPLGILQRGPRIYLVALKEESDGERHYAVDRITKAELFEPSDKARGAFNFADYIASGKADFSDGEMIELKAIVSGYVETLLYDCPLNDSQELTPLEGQQKGSSLTVTMPSSGQLLRWVLSCGSNIQVLGPEELKDTVREQIRKTYQSYVDLQDRKAD